MKRKGLIFILFLGWSLGLLSLLPSRALAILYTVEGDLVRISGSYLGVGSNSKATYTWTMPLSLAPYQTNYLSYGEVCFYHVNDFELQLTGTNYDGTYSPNYNIIRLVNFYTSDGGDDKIYVQSNFTIGAKSYDASIALYFPNDFWGDSYDPVPPKVFAFNDVKTIVGGLTYAGNAESYSLTNAQANAVPVPGALLLLGSGLLRLSVYGRRKLVSIG
jgi:hypothetical protein